MTNDPLFDALRDLPRETARAGFTRNVLLKIAESERAPGSSSPRLLWAAVASLAVVTVVAAGLYEQRRERRELRGAVGSLRAEQRELLRELEALRADRSALPVAYLGGDERNDYVLTLGALAPVSTASAVTTTRR
jgi:hypothetical protein